MPDIELVIGDDVFKFREDLLSLESSSGLESVLGFVPVGADIYPFEDFRGGEYDGGLWVEGLIDVPRVGYSALFVVKGNVGLFDKKGPFLEYVEKPGLEVARSSPVRSIFCRW